MRRFKSLGGLRGVVMVTVALFAAVPAFAQTIGVDVGGGKTVQVDPKSPLNIGLMMGGTNDSYLQTNIKAAQDAAAKTGATIHVFDAQFNPLTQLNQMQNALQTKQYNGFVVLPLAGLVVCKIATEEAPKANILVTAFHDPVCNKQLAVGEDQWSPGTLQFVGGGSSYASFLRYVTEAVKQNPGPRKAAIITGPDLVGDTLRMNKVQEEIKAKYPEFKIVSVQRTDYSPPVAQQKAQDLMQSHPDVDVIISVYSGITRGVVTALQQAGKLDKVKVYDYGGTRWSKEAIEKGWVQLSVPLYAYSVAYTAVKDMALAHQGKTVPHYVPNDGGPPDAPFFIDKSNVAQFKPESD